MKGFNKYYETVAVFAARINETTETIQEIIEKCSNVSYKQVGEIVKKSSIAEEKKEEMINYINYNNYGFVRRTYSSDRGYTQIYSTPCNIF